MFLEEISTAKKILSSHVKIDISNISNPCNLYNADTSMLTAVYLYDTNQAPDHYFGYKICNERITDYYILRSEQHVDLQNSTNEILQQHPGYHCVEYDPENDRVISKYKFNTSKITEEVKYSVENIELQRNYLCSYKYVPKMYYNDNIDIDKIIGYSCKRGVNYLLIKGLEYGICIR